MSFALLGFDLLRPEQLPWLLAAPALFVLGLWALRRRRHELQRMVEANHSALRSGGERSPGGARSMSTANFTAPQ